MRRLGRTYLCLFGLLVLFSSSSGCTAIIGVRDYLAYNDVANDFVLGYRTRCGRDSPGMRTGATMSTKRTATIREGYRLVIVTWPPAAVVPTGGAAAVLLDMHYQTPEGSQGRRLVRGLSARRGRRGTGHGGSWQQIQVSKQVQTQYSDAFQNGTIFLPRELLEGVPPSDAVGPPVTNGQPLDVLPRRRPSRGLTARGLNRCRSPNPRRIRPGCVP